MKHKGDHSEAPFTFGESVAVKMSQRTLLLILGAMIAVGVAYADLKSDVKNANATVADLVATKASDHDLLVKVATGVELLQRQADRQLLWDNRNTKAVTHP